jgi:hypothetical protein
MIDHLADQILQKIEETTELYHRLTLLVTNSETSQSWDYHQLAERLGGAYVNINLELSQRMLTLTTRQRALKVAALLDSIIMAVPHDIVLLNHIHLLFEPTLQQDPLRLLQNLSRRKTIVVIWEGELQGPHLVYAAPEHPEYRRYPARELVMVHPFAIV